LRKPFRRARGTKPRKLLLAALLVSHPSVIAAQTSAALSLFNDDRFRGYSLSDGRPVAIADLSYDDPNGFYAALSGSLVASRRSGVRPLGLILNAGYAKRLSSGLTIDAGIIHSEYSRYSDRAAERSYTEGYVGVSGKLLTARLFVSPDYLHHGSVYGEVDGNFPVAAKLRLTGHVGVLVPLSRSAYRENYGRDIDWRIGLTRQFGRLSAQAAWTGVRPGHELYQARQHHRDALILGLTYAL